MAVIILSPKIYFMKKIWINFWKRLKQRCLEHHYILKFGIRLPFTATTLFATIYLWMVTREQDLKRVWLS